MLELIGYDQKGTQIPGAHEQYKGVYFWEFKPITQETIDNLNRFQLQPYVSMSERERKIYINKSWLGLQRWGDPISDICLKIAGMISGSMTLEAGHRSLEYISEGYKYDYPSGSVPELPLLHPPVHYRVLPTDR
jgi:hypothetical protein